MSYEPTVWKSGDTVTSAKLNKLEQALANNSQVFLVNIIAAENRLDKTMGEILDAFQQKTVLAKVEMNDYFQFLRIDGIVYMSDEYTILLSLQGFAFTATSLDDYPTLPQN